jgi:hypothetical protein
MRQAMSAFGPKQTSASAAHTSGPVGKADARRMFCSNVFNFFYLPVLPWLRAGAWLFNRR